jgi:hypothetical protein
LKLSPPDITPSQAFVHYAIVLGTGGKIWVKFRADAPASREFLLPHNDADVGLKATDSGLKSTAFDLKSTAFDLEATVSDLKSMDFDPEAAASDLEAMDFDMEAAAFDLKSTRYILKNKHALIPCGRFTSRKGKNRGGK